MRDYFRRSGLSRFCLIPAGLTAWTIHLYEAFFFGFSDSAEDLIRHLPVS